MKIKSDSAYSREELGGGKTRFTVTAAELAPGVGVIILIFILGLLSYGVLFLLFLVIPIARNMHRKKTSAGGEFVVSPAGIEMKGHLLPVEQMHRLVKRNAYANVPDRYIYAPGAVGTAFANAASHSQSIYTSVAYKLDVDHGGKATTLAGGMSDITAHGLMTDVSRILGLS